MGELSKEALFKYAPHSTLVPSGRLCNPSIHRVVVCPTSYMVETPVGQQFSWRAESHGSSSFRRCRSITNDQKKMPNGILTSHTKRLPHPIINSQAYGTFVIILGRDNSGSRRFLAPSEIFLNVWKWVLHGLWGFEYAALRLLCLTSHTTKVKLAIFPWVTHKKPQKIFSTSIWWLNDGTHAFTMRKRHTMREK